MQQIFTIWPSANTIPYLLVLWSPLCNAHIHVKQPSLSMICKWLNHSWALISDIVKTFKKTGISPELESSEEDILWQECEAS
ncbi:hypothetical protein PR048_029709 [Dryococelus australis]|uniref:Uncharacterized protein n=1 Tax=Dryococelus australis TaxID=614101 RepID=A0ABQ9GE50_9NEOP|nr:hypothetical protein PR048_029709 [Dryococelus australis]